MGMIYGASGCGKTFLALDMVHAIATGRPWLGRATQKGRALYVAAEGAAGFPGRVQAWYRARGEPSLENMRYLRRRFALHDANERQLLVEALDGFLPLDFLVIDTAGANGPDNFDDNLSAHWKAIFDAGVDLTERLRTTIAFIHHPGHSGDRLRGSYDQIARADVIMRVEKVADFAGRLKLEKHRDFAWEGWIDFTLRKVRAKDEAEPLSLVPELAAPHDGLSAAELSALKALANSKGPLKAKAWETASGLARRTFYRVRLALIAEPLNYVATKGSTYFITESGRAAILDQCQVPSSASECHDTEPASSATLHPPYKGGSGTSRLTLAAAPLNGVGEDYELAERRGMQL